MSEHEQEHEHNHGHRFTIIVNTRETEVKKHHLNFDEVVKIAYPEPPQGKNIVYTVTYRKADGKKKEGSLSEGQSVKIKDGTIFNVTPTDKS